VSTGTGRNGRRVLPGPAGPRSSGIPAGRHLRRLEPGRRQLLRFASGWTAAALAGLSGFPLRRAFAADAATAHAAALLGYWFAVSPDPARARVLRITDVLFVEDDAALLAGVYGPASAPIWPEAAEISLRRADSGWLVTVVASKDEAPIVLASGADGSLNGVLVDDGAGGTELRFVRAALPEIHEYAARQPLPGLRAGRDSRIEFVYIGAHDCSMCRQWEDIQLGPDGRLTRSPLWPQITFTAIRLPTLRKPFAIDDAPPRLHPVLHDMLARGVPVRGVPSFLLLVDGRLRAHALGPAAFNSLLLPTLGAAVREKLAAS